jgi:hypothetical protein
MPGVHREDFTILTHLNRAVSVAIGSLAAAGIISCCRHRVKGTHAQVRGRSRNTAYRQIILQLEGLGQKSLE